MYVILILLIGIQLYKFKVSLKWGEKSPKEELQFLILVNPQHCYDIKYSVCHSAAPSVAVLSSETSSICTTEEEFVLDRGLWEGTGLNGQMKFFI